MELVFIILAIGVVFMMNSGRMSKDKLVEIANALEGDLIREFTKRDNKIKDLEERIEKLENT